MSITIGIRKAVIDGELKRRIDTLSDETKELALAYVVGTYLPLDTPSEHWNPGIFHGDLAVEVWEKLGIKFIDREPVQANAQEKD